MEDGDRSLSGAVLANFGVLSGVLSVLAVGSSSSKYLQLTFRMSKHRPKSLGGAYIVLAWYFALNLALVVTEFEPANAFERMMRAAFGFGAITMLYGPFLVLTPTRPVVLEKETFFKRLVVGAQRKETRYTAFAMFCLITLAQGFVVFSLWTVMFEVLQLRLEYVLGITVGYGLVAIFYLVIFYSVMMKKDVVVGGINLLDIIRRNMIFQRRHRRAINLLDNKVYVYVYLFLFAICTVVAGFLIYDLYAFETSGSGGLSGLPTLDQVVVVGFLVFNCIAVVTFVVFIANVAFNPLKSTQVRLDDGSIVAVNLIKYVGIARSSDRVMLCRYTAPHDAHRHLVEPEIEQLALQAPTTPGHRQEQGYFWGKVVQANDAVCMTFIATGAEYNTALAYLLADHVHDYTINTLAESPEAVAALAPNAWTGSMTPFLASAVALFSDEAEHKRLVKVATERDQDRVQLRQLAPPAKEQLRTLTDEARASLAAQYKKKPLSAQPLVTHSPAAVVREQIIDTLREEVTEIPELEGALMLTEDQVTTGAEDLAEAKPLPRPREWKAGKKKKARKAKPSKPPAQQVQQPPPPPPQLAQPVADASPPLPEPVVLKEDEGEKERKPEAAKKVKERKEKDKLKADKKAKKKEKEKKQERRRSRRSPRRREMDESKISEIQPVTPAGAAQLSTLTVSVGDVARAALLDDTDAVAIVVSVDSLRSLHRARELVTAVRAHGRHPTILVLNKDDLDPVTWAVSAGAFHALADQLAVEQRLQVSAYSLNNISTLVSMVTRVSTDAARLLLLGWPGTGRASLRHAILFGRTSILEPAVRQSKLAALAARPLYATIPPALLDGPTRAMFARMQRLERMAPHASPLVFSPDHGHTSALRVVGGAAATITYVGASRRGSGTQTALTMLPASSGVVHWEVQLMHVLAPASVTVGFVAEDPGARRPSSGRDVASCFPFPPPKAMSGPLTDLAMTNALGRVHSGKVYRYAPWSLLGRSPGQDLADGDVISARADFDAGTISFAANGVYLGWCAAIPAGSVLYPAVSLHGSNDGDDVVVKCDFGTMSPLRYPNAFSMSTLRPFVSWPMSLEAAKQLDNFDKADEVKKTRSLFGRQSKSPSLAVVTAMLNQSLVFVRVAVLGVSAGGVQGPGLRPDEALALRDLGIAALHKLEDNGASPAHVMAVQSWMRVVTAANASVAYFAAQDELNALAMTSDSDGVVKLVTSYIQHLMAVLHPVMGKVDERLAVVNKAKKNKDEENESEDEEGSDDDDDDGGLIGL